MEEAKVTISIRGFSRKIGVSDTAVRKAIAAKKIVKGVVLKANGRPTIDEEVARAEWLENGGPMQALSRGITDETKLTPKPTVEPKTAPRPTPSPKKSKDKNEVFNQLSLDDGLEDLDGDDSQLKLSFTDANRKKAIYESQIKELELAEKQGVLVNKDKIYKTLYKFGQEVRNKVEAIPDRIIDNLMACKTRTDGHTLLAAAITEALATLAEMSEEKLIT